MDEQLEKKRAYHKEYVRVWSYNRPQAIQARHEREMKYREVLSLKEQGYGDIYIANKTGYSYSYIKKLYPKARAFIKRIEMEDLDD